MSDECSISAPCGRGRGLRPREARQRRADLEKKSLQQGINICFTYFYLPIPFLFLIMLGDFITLCIIIIIHDIILQIVIIYMAYAFVDA